MKVRSFEVQTYEMGLMWAMGFWARTIATWNPRTVEQAMCEMLCDPIFEAHKDALRTAWGL
jgi:hypothetical protein